MLLGQPIKWQRCAGAGVHVQKYCCRLAGMRVLGPCMSAAISNDRKPGLDLSLFVVASRYRKGKSDNMVSPQKPVE